jgi:hypothetical protein
MRNKHYKSYSFRLNDETLDDIKRQKKKNGKSYNLLFLEFLKIFKKHYKTKEKK